MKGRARLRAITAPIAAGIAILALTGCSTMEVSTDFDPRADFTNLKTYDWISEPRKPTGDPRIDNNTILEGRIQTAVDGELSARGFTRTDAGTADFLVAYHVSLDKQRSVQHLNDYYGYGPGWGYSYGATRRPAYYGGSSTYVYEYEEGTLILDIVKPEGRELMWRGAARDEVRFSKSPESDGKQLTEAVTRMLEHFPPG
jgi:hypothetical protein